MIRIHRMQLLSIVFITVSYAYTADSQEEKKSVTSLVGCRKSSLEEYYQLQQAYQLHLAQQREKPEVQYTQLIQKNAAKMAELNERFRAQIAQNAQKEAAIRAKAKAIQEQEDRQKKEALQKQRIDALRTQKIRAQDAAIKSIVARRNSAYDYIKNPPRDSMFRLSFNNDFAKPAVRDISAKARKGSHNEQPH